MPTQLSLKKEKKNRWIICRKQRGEKCGWNSRWLSVWARGCLCWSLHHPLDTTHLAVRVHTFWGGGCACFQILICNATSARIPLRHWNKFQGEWETQAGLRLDCWFSLWSFDIKHSNKVKRSFQLAAGEFLVRPSFSSRIWSQDMNILSMPHCKLSNLGRGWQMRTGKPEETDYLQIEICIQQENTNCSWWGFWWGGVAERT